jgi:hypothetical protein
VAGAAVLGVGLLLAPRALRLGGRIRDLFGSGFSGAQSPIVSGRWKTPPGEYLPGQRIPSASSTPSPGAVGPADDGAASAAR